MMTRSSFDDAFAHHCWATLRLLDACAGLTAEQIETAVPGTYGPILDTLRHLVEADSLYLAWLTGDERHLLDGGLSVQDLKGAMERNRAAWTEVLASDRDTEMMVQDVDEAGYRRDASVGLRLAQALHHGSDHRSQVCTALTLLGVEPPQIDLWDFGLETGRVVEIAPAP